MHICLILMKYLVLKRIKNKSKNFLFNNVKFLQLRIIYNFSAKQLYKFDQNFVCIYINH